MSASRLRSGRTRRWNRAARRRTFRSDDCSRIDNGRPRGFRQDGWRGVRVPAPPITCGPNERNDVSSRIVVSGPPVERSEEILTPAALDFLAGLHDTFAERRDELLARRQCRRDAVAVGEPMDFLAETADIRAGDHGPSLPSRPISPTAGWRSPARRIAR